MWQRKRAKNIVSAEFCIKINIACLLYIIFLYMLDIFLLIYMFFDNNES